MEASHDLSDERSMEAIRAAEEFSSSVRDLLTRPGDNLAPEEIDELVAHAFNLKLSILSETPSADDAAAPAEGGQVIELRASATTEALSNEQDPEEDESLSAAQAGDLAYESLRDVVVGIHDEVRGGRWFSREITPIETDTASERRSTKPEGSFRIPDGFEQEVSDLINRSDEPVHIGHIVRQYFGDKLPRDDFKKVLETMRNLCQSGSIVYIGKSFYKGRQTVAETIAQPPVEFWDNPPAPTPKKSLGEMLREAGIHDTARPARRNRANRRRR